MSLYAIVTPARDESSFIGKTIEAVLSQTVLPQKWVIVDDGSIDRTSEIVAGYAHTHSWIQLVSTAGNAQKDFGSKVHAFCTGYAQLRDVSYEFLANLDADVTFSPRYFEQVFERFQANPKLGVAGGIILEFVNGRFLPQNTSINSVAGAVQCFRRQCYEAFGGYVPIEKGGIDAAAEIMARMHGWVVQTFPEIHVYHHRRVSTGGAKTISTRFRQGATNYLLGYHPLFQFLSSMSRISNRPFMIGSMCTLLGYLLSWFKGSEPVLPKEVVDYLRAEQMARIGQIL